MTGRSNITDLICVYIYVYIFIYIYLHCFYLHSSDYFSFPHDFFLARQTTHTSHGHMHKDYKIVPKTNPKVAQPCTFLGPRAHTFFGHILR